MAATWIKPVRKAKGHSTTATLADRIGCADNPNKTNSYKFVKSYGCDYYTAAIEFAMAKELYEQQTGRGERNGDILAYHVRQSFKPGKITPQMLYFSANRTIKISQPQRVMIYLFPAGTLYRRT
jgi:hypothetical protein